MKKVFLTGEIHPEAVALLMQHAAVIVAPDSSFESLVLGIEDADAVVVRHPLPSDIFRAASRLRCAVRHGAGVDLIPVDEASQLGILVANVPGINAPFVAEYAIGQIINLSRRLVQTQSAFRAGSWDRGKELALGSSQLRGKTVGIIGYGAIGKALAQICIHGFAMNVVAKKRSGQHDGVKPEVERLELDELLNVSDFVVVSCPLTEQTKGLIDDAAFSNMKQTAFLINVARGPIVSSAALMKALEQKKIAGGALDVYDETPLRPDSPLFDFEELLLTPHVAAMTADSMREMALESAVQVIDVLQGKYPKNWINTGAKQEISSRWNSLNSLV